MKSMNKKEGKKIAVMAAVIMGLMLFAFMPMASAAVTSFTVTPSTGLAGAVDSYNVLVTTTGVNTLNISIPRGFIAAPPANGGVEIARVDFWNTSTRDYYGYGTVTANNLNPAGAVDVYCKMQVGGDEVIFTRTENVNYAPGGFTTLVVEYPEGAPVGTATVDITLPTEMDNGCMNITIDCFSLDLLEDVHIAVRQFVRNPPTAGDYTFSADGVDETVQIIEAGGCGAVFRQGVWFLDTNGDHNTDMYYRYGTTGDIPVVGDVNKDGRDDDAVFRNGVWYVDLTGDHVTNMYFIYGAAGDVPLIGDFNQDGTDDTAVFRNGVWFVDTTGNHMTNMCFTYGAAGDQPLIGDFNQDGDDDTAVFRNGVWYVDLTGDHMTNMCFTYGAAGDQPIVGDINQDGHVDTAVLRNGIWFVDTTGNHWTNLNYIYGAAGDLKIGGYFR